MTTEACLTEAMYLAGSRIGRRGQNELWQVFDGLDLSVFTLDMKIVRGLMQRYRDVPMDFADATLVALASAEAAVRVATFDSDFLAYRRTDGTPIPLVGDGLLGWS